MSVIEKTIQHHTRLDFDIYSGSSHPVLLISASISASISLLRRISRLYMSFSSLQFIVGILLTVIFCCLPIQVLANTADNIVYTKKEQCLDEYNTITFADSTEKCKHEVPSTKTETDYKLLWQVIIGCGILLLVIWLWNRRLISEIKLRKEEAKESERKLQSSNQRLELATDTVGLSVWEVLFPQNLSQKPLTIDCPELDKILVYDDRDFFKQTNSPLQTIEVNKADYCNIGEGYPKKNLMTLRRWLIAVVDKDSLLQHFNDIRVNKKRRHIEAELYDESGVYDNPSDAHKIFYASISYDDSQEQKKIVGTKWDVTELKKNERALLLSNKRIESARQQAEIASQAKTDFLATMSHEIRTPLNVILGYTELLNEKATDKKQKKILTTINSAGQNLLVLVNDVLDISKIEAGKLDICPIVCDLYNLMEATGDIFESKLSDKNIDFHLTYNPNIPSSLFLDEKRIRQILVNLIGNAIKFTHQGSITLSAKLLSTNLSNSTVDIAIEVTDTGIGMVEKDLASIFDKFEQVDSNSTREYEGVGLGLSICSRLVDMMDGEILVTSTLDVGSTFQVILRNTKIATLSSSIEDEQQLMNFANIEFEPASIMIVDDIKDNRDLITDVFASTELEILTAENGKQAIQMMESYKVDLIFMDLYMPEMNGYQATRTIKEKYDIPIIVLTASLLEEYGLEERQLFNGFLNKPILKSDLYQTIMQHLPFTQCEENIVAVTPPVSAEQAKVEVEYLPIVIDALIKLQPRYQALIKENDINATRQLAKDIRALMDEYPIAQVMPYIDEFEDNLNNFSIKGFRQSLKDFDTLSDALKSRHENEV